MDMEMEMQGKAPLTASVKSPLHVHREPDQADRKRSRQRKVLCCFGVCAAITVVMVALLVILLFTVFKRRDPKIRVDSVTLHGLNVNVGNIFTSPNLSVDVDLLTGISVENPNYAGFDYRNTTAYMYYQDIVIGTSTIPPGSVKSRSTVQMTTGTNLHISGSVINAQLTRDVASGVLPIVTTVQIKGTAKIFGAIRIKDVRTSSSCDVNIFLRNQTLSFHCDYSVKL